MRIDIDHLTLPEPESVSLLKAEVRRLEGVITALADQAATLSVCNGNVTVTMDATLTAEEREALTRAVTECERVAREYGIHSDDRRARALRGLLERL
jgi:hypothetical protein